jgi:hypothetical protein
MDSSNVPPAVRIRIRWCPQGLFLEYAGRPEALLAAGAGTPDMLQPGQRGVPRFDADGDRFAMTRQYNTGRVVLSRWKSPERAAGLPGVEAWLDANTAVRAS